MVGSAIVRGLEEGGLEDLLLQTHDEVDLTDARAVNSLFQKTQPEYVFVAAAKVGGILANDTFPADFIRDNLAIQLNVIDAAYRHSVTKLLFLGSSCIYPKNAQQPITEHALLEKPLDVLWHLVTPAPCASATKEARPTSLETLEARHRLIRFLQREIQLSQGSRRLSHRIPDEIRTEPRPSSRRAQPRRHVHTPATEAVAEHRKW